MYSYSKLPELEPKDLDMSQWSKPKTTRRNLQPPKSERLINLWAGGKIVFGRVYDGSDVVDKKNGHEYWSDETGCGWWMLYGEDREDLDFRLWENFMTEDGAPIHGMRFLKDGALAEIEAFCDTARKSTCFIKASVKNTTDQPMKPMFSFMLRTGTIHKVAGSADHYHSYIPRPHYWKEDLQPTWYPEGEVFTDGKYVLSVRGDKLPEWNQKAGTLDWKLDLAPGESWELTFMLNQGEAADHDYAAQKELTVCFWNRELARLNKLPESWKKEPETVKMVRHMVTQMLQHTVYNEGKDYLFFRQGGLRCIGFPGDTMWAFEILARLGDFSDYLEPMLETYFDVMQQEDGEIVNIGIYWAMITSTVLFSFAQYCRYTGETGRRFYEKYKDKAFAGFDWIRRTRKSTLGSDTLVQGLFPPLRACDYVQVYQNWQITDNYNIMNLKPYAALLKQYGDPAAGQVQQEIEEYVAAMQTCIRPFLEAQKDSDELYIPLCPDGNDRELVRDDYPMYHYPKFILNDIIGTEYSDKIYRWLVGSNRSNGVFYGRTIVLKENSVWYISAAEISWFQLYQRIGDHEKMREILRTQREYTVTEEYHMMERIVIGDPFYLPWTPNVSAMARLLWMMLAVDELDKKV